MTKERFDELNKFYDRLIRLYEDMTGNHVVVIMNNWVITGMVNERYTNCDDFISAVLDEMKEQFKI